MDKSRTYYAHPKMVGAVRAENKIIFFFNHQILNHLTSSINFLILKFPEFYCLAILYYMPRVAVIIKHVAKVSGK